MHCQRTENSTVNRKVLWCCSYRDWWQTGDLPCLQTYPHPCLPGSLAPTTASFIVFTKPRGTPPSHKQFTAHNTLLRQTVGMAPTILSTTGFKSVLHSSVSRNPGCAHAACSSAFRPCVPKVCCMQTVCLGKTNEKHNLKVIWNVYVGPSGWIKAGPWKARKECAVQ